MASRSHVNERSVTTDSEVDSYGSGASSEDVLTHNIIGAKIVGDFISTTLGPRGMDKLLLDKDDAEEGLTTYFEVTNNGAYLLKRLPFESPGARVIARVAAAQEERCGDGTTTTAIYASEILRAVEPLIEQGLHPTTVISGIEKAVNLCTETIHNKSIPIDLSHDDLLRSVARTTLQGKTAEPIIDSLSQWSVDAVQTIAQEQAEGVHVNTDLVQIESLRSGTISDTELVDGMVLKKSFAGNHDPSEIKNPTIAVVNQGFARAEAIRHRISDDGHSSTQSVSYDISDPESTKSLSEFEVEYVAELIDPLVEAGVDVVFVGDRVEEDILPYFDAAEIAVVRNAREGRMKKIVRATGASINTSLRNFEKDDTGTAKRLERRRYPGIEQNAIVLWGGAGDQVVSVLAHGSTWMSGWELERNVMNAIRSVGAAVESKQVVPGGGAIEITLARKLRAEAPKIGGRESLVVEAVADGIEGIPKTLARNAGMDVVDSITTMRAANHDGREAVGVLGRDQVIGDVVERRILEPAASKQYSLQSASSVATTILRIDDVIAAGE